MEVQTKRLSDDSPASRFDDFFENLLRDDINKLLSSYPQKKSLEVDFHLLERFDHNLADNVLLYPDEYLAAAENALSSRREATALGDEFKPYVRFYNLPATSQVEVLNLGAEHLDKLITLEGVASSISEIKPRMTIAVWQCNACQRKYHLPVGKVEPLQPPLFCSAPDCGGASKFTLLEKGSNFTDMQSLGMQDPVEKMRGNMPTVHAELWLEDDLTNTVAPGDKVVVTGVLRLKPINEGKVKKSIYQKFVDVNSIRKIEIDFEELQITKEEEKQLAELARDPKLFDKIVASVAPSIFGYNELKQAIALQLFGGTHGKVLPDGEVIRSDTHILMIGDPGTAKSTMLEYVARLAPKCIIVSGGGASGVGLCVAPESLILNDNGLRPIKDFVESAWNGSAREELPGALAQDFDGSAWTLGEDLKLSQKRVSKIWRIKAPPEMVGIRTRSGKAVRMTPATSLVVLDGRPAWKTAGSVGVGDFVATARKLPEGGSRTPVARILEAEPNLRVDANLCAVFRQVTDRLAAKHGSIRRAAKAVGVPEGELYTNRLPKYWSNMRLATLLKLAREVGLEAEVERGVSGVFLRYGKTTRVPEVLEDERLAYLAGLLLGDGDVSVRSNSAVMRFSNTSPELLEAFASGVSRVFGRECRRAKASWRIPSMRFGSVPAFLLFKELGLSNKKTEITLSHSALSMPNPVLSKLLRGLYDTDGYVATPKGRGSPSVGISTVSPNLAKRLHLALLKFGIHSKLRLRRKAGTIAKGRSITVTSRHDAHVVEIRGRGNLERFSASIGFNLPKKALALRALLSSGPENTNVDLVPVSPVLLGGLGWAYRTGKTRPSRSMLLNALGKTPEKGLLGALADSDVYWDEVESVERFTPDYEWVYDFSVEGTHNFVCDGFFVHNTASAEKNEISGGWVLKAGAMVLANGGLVGIDEMDKMKEEDRAAIHQAMEQQKISVAKAGIVTEFQSKTAVLAAANPKQGRFGPNTPIASQFALSPTLLSRFDLIFAMKDTLDEKRDRGLAEHILEGHRYAGTRDKGESPIVPVIEADLLRKYIAYARRTVAPELTREASDKIRDYYVELRRQGKEQNTFTVTARQIEGLIRIAEAHAKMRLSRYVEFQDAQKSIDLADFVLHEIYFDRETGRIDSDIVNLGQAKSKLDKIRNVLSIIGNLEREVDLVAVDDVVREAASFGLDESYTRRLIDELKKQGDLYEPKPGHIKQARAREW